MADIPISEIMQKIAGVDSSKIQGLNKVIMFDLTGEGGGQWTLSLKDGQAQVNEGPADDPDMTISIDADDFRALTSGQLNAMSAFMQGKIKISGDMSLAMQLQNILSF